MKRKNQEIPFDKKEITLAPTQFDEIIKKNKEIEEKLKQERKQTNTNVKKSYRLE